VIWLRVQIRFAV